MRKVLLIRTIDDRLFFTDVANFPQLIEFGKAFGTEISVVKTEDKADVLPLPKLAKLFCTPGYVPEAAQYDIVEHKLGFNGAIPKPPNKRSKTLSQAKAIRIFIESTFLAGKVVSLEDLADGYRGLGLSNQALRNHVNYVRNKLESVGHEIVKCGVGSYRLEK